MSKQKQQIRAYQLNQNVQALLESGLWGTLYDDLATCYRSVGLTIPAGFVLSAPNEEDAGDVAKQINDKRIQVKTDARLSEGKFKLDAIFK